MSETQNGGSRKPRLREAYERVAPQLAAVAKSELRRITLSVPSVVATIQGALPQIRPFRAQIQEELVKYDLALFDRVEEATLALAYAHGNWLAAKEPNRSLEEIGDEAGQLRELMLADAQTQVLRRIFDRRLIAKIQSGSGYEDTADDLLALVSLYRAHWTAIGGQTGVTAANIELAEILADQLLTDVGVRDRKPIQRSAAVEERLRAFAVCLRAYNHARRAIQYLRFEEGDAERIAPSLYAGRTKAAPEEGDEADGAPDLDEAELNATKAEAASPSASKIGMPDSDPFTE